MLHVETVSANITYWLTSGHLSVGYSVTLIINQCYYILYVWWKYFGRVYFPNISTLTSIIGVYSLLLLSVFQLFGQLLP